MELLSDTGFSNSVVDDEELTRLALAADTSIPLSKDATAWTGLDYGSSSVLPAWYMPVARARVTNQAAKVAIVVVILGFLIIDAFGLCITSGFLSLP